MHTSKLMILASAVAVVTATAAHAADIPATPAQPEIDRRDIAAPVPPPAPGDDRAVLVPTVKEYQWIFHVPVISVAHRRVAVTTLSATTHPKRWEYDTPTLRDKRIKLWDVPEFSCKYADLILPNECRTVWHAVYVDVPVLVNAHTHLDIDVLRLGVAETYIDVDVPLWTWAEKSFRFSLPAFALPASVERVRASLESQRAAVTVATDETIANIDRQIALVQASGGDPARLVSSEGSDIDLLAQRQTLLDERAQELERLAAIDAELSAFSARR
jgi:hypothetical protein